MSSAVTPYHKPYSLPSDVSNILNITFSGSTVPTTTQVQDLIVRADSWIDQVSGHNWLINDATELYDAVGTGPRAGMIVLKNRPVISVDVVEYWQGGSVTQGGVAGTNVWIAGVQSMPEESPNLQTYYVYLPEGKIVWHKLRLDRRQGYRVRYSWGYQSAPDFVRDLSSTVAALDILIFWGSQLSLQENIDQFRKRLEAKKYRLESRATQRPSAAVG
jgi:hypothetical protein